MVAGRRAQAALLTAALGICLWLAGADGFAVSAPAGTSVAPAHRALVSALPRAAALQHTRPALGRPAGRCSLCRLACVDRGDFRWVRLQHGWLWACPHASALMCWLLRQGSIRRDASGQRPVAVAVRRVPGRHPVCPPTVAALRFHTPRPRSRPSPRPCCAQHARGGGGLRLGQTPAICQELPLCCRAAGAAPHDATHRNRRRRCLPVPGAQHACTSPGMRACISMHIHMNVLTRIHVRTHAYTHARTRAYMHTHMHPCTHAHLRRRVAT